MILNRMTLFLELVFSTELIREEVYCQPFLREHALPGETVAESNSCFCSLWLWAFPPNAKVLAIVGKKLRFTSILVSYCLRIAVSTARLLKAQKFLWKIPVPQHWTYFWENFTRTVWHFSSWQLGGVISVLKNLEMLTVQINSVSLKICYNFSLKICCYQ